MQMRPVKLKSFGNFHIIKHHEKAHNNNNNIFQIIKILKILKWHIIPPNFANKQCDPPSNYACPVSHPGT